MLVEPSEPEVEGWLVVGCVSTVGAGAPDAGEPEGAPLGGGWEASDGGVGAGEVVVGGGVLAVVVGGGGVAVGAQAAGVPVASSSVGVHVTCAVAGPAGSAIDALGATIIVASCRRPAHATAHSPRCAPRLDMHVLRLILVLAPKLTTTTSNVGATVSYAVVANHPTVSAKLITM